MGVNKGGLTLLSFLVITNSIYFIMFYVIIILLGLDMNKKLSETLVILRKWVNRNSDGDSEVLMGNADRIMDGPAVVSCFMFNFDMELVGEFIYSSLTYLFILIQFDEQNE